MDPKDFARATGLQLKSTSGKLLTTFCIGGEIAKLIEVNSIDQLRNLVRFLFQHDLQFKILGAGSNLLIPDRGVDAFVIKLGKGFRTFERVSSSIFEVGGSYPLMTLARELSNEGLSGLEFAAGIPASFGGAIRMNSGAHGAEISSLIQSINCVLCSGEEIRFEAADLQFSYRNSSFPEDAIVTSAVIRLSAGDRQKTSSTMKNCLEYRKATQPLQLPSAGSVFKNPASDLPAGRVLEECGVKGYVVGGAKVSEQHANWIVNESRMATASDVLKVIGHCQQIAREKKNLELHPEIVCW